MDNSLFIVNNEVCVPEDQLRYSAGKALTLPLCAHTTVLPVCAEIQWRGWSTLDLSLMLISAMQHSPSPAAHLSLVFHYFDPNSPLLSFLKFHEEFVLRNDCEESKKYLNEFRLNMDNVRAL